MSTKVSPPPPAETGGRDHYFLLCLYSEMVPTSLGNTFLDPNADKRPLSLWKNLHAFRRWEKVLNKFFKWNTQSKRRGGKSVSFQWGQSGFLLVICVCPHMGPMFSFRITLLIAVHSDYRIANAIVSLWAFPPFSISYLISHWCYSGGMPGTFAFYLFIYFSLLLISCWFLDNLITLSAPHFLNLEKAYFKIHFLCSIWYIIITYNILHMKCIILHVWNM